MEVSKEERAEVALIWIVAVTKDRLAFKLIIIVVHLGLYVIKPCIEFVILLFSGFAQAAVSQIIFPPKEICPKPAKSLKNIFDKRNKNGIRTYTITDQ